ncbi:MAG: hypothetical protein ABSD75_22260 [Terriglobales bacterium]
MKPITRSKSKLPLTLGVAAVALIASACHRSGAYRALTQAAEGPVQGAKVVAVYLPWFGDPEHIKVGYSTDDPAVLRRQIAKAEDLGVQAFAVDWYGERRPFLDHSYAMMQQVASQSHFKVALMYDETEEDNGKATEESLAEMAKAYDSYLRPGASGRDAYLEYHGRPVIFIFPKRGHTDWNRVRTQVDDWPLSPWLIYKDDPPPQYANAFEGNYAWVHPSKGWARDGSDWGKEYLEAFYQKMQSRPGKIAVDTVWPGFDDTHASWSLDRHIDERCGKTFEDTLRLFRFYNQVKPIPFLMIATWNDYEEGTAIESGVGHNCGGLATKGSHPDGF